MKKCILVLGAGFGGLELCTMLSVAFGESIDPAILPMNLRMPILIINRLRILRFMGATRAKEFGVVSL